MRYYTYLNEKKIPIPNEKNYHPRLVTRMINDNLYEILSQNNIFKLCVKNEKNILYRGAKRDIYHYDLLQRYKDRKPKDMPKNLHDLFDYEFNKKFGWKARSEGVFVTSALNHAVFYGKAYVFIPKTNTFRFIYSRSIKDLYSEASGEDYDFLDEIDVCVLNDDKNMIDYLISQDFYSGKLPTKNEVIDKIMKSYKNNNIQNAIVSRNEIMFDCDEYFMFETSVFKQILKDFK